jgi:uncharacterized membrane protein YedE/YeeE
MFDFIEHTMNSVASQGHGSVLTVFLIGLTFGTVIQWSRVDTFEKIAGFSMLKDFTMIKLVLLATGIITIGLHFLVQLDLASYSPKPILLGGLIIGGVIFGVGMSVFGKCPGTGSISLAEGRIDVLIGIIGGLVGGAVFTIFFTDIQPLLGENLGKIQLIDFTGEYTSLFVIAFGTLLIVASILIPSRELHYDKE